MQIAIGEGQVSPSRASVGRAMTCPACGGAMIEIRAALRCLRCRCVVCESCDGGLNGPENDASAEDQNGR